MRNLKAFSKRSGVLRRPFAVGIFADERNHFAHQIGDALLREFHLIFVQHDFRWLCSFSPSSCQTAWRSAESSPAYSKALLLVSSTRTRSSLASGKCFRRLKISMQTFSVVGTCSRKTGTSSFSER